MRWRGKAQETRRLAVEKFAWAGVTALRRLGFIGLGCGTR